MSNDPVYKHQHFLKNKDKYLLRSKLIRLNNPDSIKEYMSEYRQLNKHTLNTRHAIWVAANKESYYKSKIKWDKNNSGKVNAKTKLYKVNKLSRTPKWLSKAQLKEIEQYYIDSSYVQQLMQTSMAIDHIVPLQGKNVSGLHVPWNLQILTAKENAEKSNKWQK